MLSSMLFCVSVGAYAKDQSSSVSRLEEHACVQFTMPAGLCCLCSRLLRCCEIATRLLSMTSRWPLPVGNSTRATRLDGVHRKVGKSVFNFTSDHVYFFMPACDFTPGSLSIMHVLNVRARHRMAANSKAQSF